MGLCLTKYCSKGELFLLTSQMRRRAVFIPSNFGERLGIKPTKETILFMHIAKGSLFVLIAQFILTKDLVYRKSNYSSALSVSGNVKKLLNGF